LSTLFTITNTSTSHFCKCSILVVADTFRYLVIVFQSTYFLLISCGFVILDHPSLRSFPLFYVAWCLFSFCTFLAIWLVFATGLLSSIPFLLRNSMQKRHFDILYQVQTHTRARARARTTHARTHRWRLISILAPMGSASTNDPTKKR